MHLRPRHQVRVLEDSHLIFIHLHLLLLTHQYVRQVHIGEQSLHDTQPVRITASFVIEDTVMVNVVDTDPIADVEDLTVRKQ